jgi:hypothetical protein
MNNTRNLRDYVAAKATRSGATPVTAIGTPIPDLGVPGLTDPNELVNATVLLIDAARSRGK